MYSRLIDFFLIWGVPHWDGWVGCMWVWVGVGLCGSVWVCVGLWYVPHAHMHMHVKHDKHGHSQFLYMYILELHMSICMHVCAAGRWYPQTHPHLCPQTNKS